MADPSGSPRPRLRHEGAFVVGLGAVGAVVAQFSVGGPFYGWTVGVFLAVVGGPVLARRWPDLADPRPAKSPGRWQQAVVVVLAIAVGVALAIALTRPS
jgi:hypothetical protein